MRKLILFLFLLLSGSASAQLEKVIVEKYYISDANDATDTTGGYLAPGSVTYRIYIDLSKGSRLNRIYGDANHVLRFASTDAFFNNKADGQTFGRDFPKNRLGENTVALDSWITLGQTTRNATKTCFGVMKGSDDDGSFIGGANNDGGSALISSGLIANADPLAGIAVSISDGMDTMIVLPSSWGDYGFKDIITGDDSTIFGSLIPGSEFVSYNAGLQNSGVAGVNPDSNLVLVAQLTTKGALSFSINVEVQDSLGNIIYYVSSDSVLLAGEVYDRYLSYPYEEICGCPDPYYLEYLEDRDCDDVSMCQNLIVFGCLDTSACNYNPDANFHLSMLCCYPGYCNDRNLDVVCYGISAERTLEIQSVHPNPATDHITILTNSFDFPVQVELYNYFGRRVYADVNTISYSGSFILPLYELENGIYIIQVTSQGSTARKTFTKTR